MENNLKKKLKEVELVIFDLDGTLIDSNGASNYLDIKLAHMLGETKIREEIIQERDEFFKRNKEGDIYLNYCDFLKKKYNSNLEKEEILKIRRELSKKIAKDIKLKPDVEKFVKNIRDKKIKTALATVSRRETIDIYINENENIKNKCNLKDNFDIIVTKDDVKLKKPNPEVYNKIVKRFNIYDLSKYVIIEDSLSGVMAAKNAQIDVISIYDKYSDKDREQINKIANYRVRNYKELIESIEN